VIRFVRIFTEVPRGGASNDSELVENGKFQRFRWLFFDTLEIRPALLYGDMQSVVGFSEIPKCMTLNDLTGYFALNLFLRRFGWLTPCDFGK